MIWWSFCGEHFFPLKKYKKTFKAYQIMRHLSSNNIMSWGPCSVCTAGHDMIILTAFHVMFFEYKPYFSKIDNRFLIIGLKCVQPCEICRLVYEPRWRKWLNWLVTYCLEARFTSLLNVRQLWRWHPSVSSLRGQVFLWLILTSLSLKASKYTVLFCFFS